MSYQNEGWLGCRFNIEPNNTSVYCPAFAIQGLHHYDMQRILGLALSTQDIVDEQVVDDQATDEQDVDEEDFDEEDVDEEDFDEQDVDEQDVDEQDVDEETSEDETMDKQVVLKKFVSKPYYEFMQKCFYASIAVPYRHRSSIKIDATELQHAIEIVCVVPPHKIKHNGSKATYNLVVEVLSDHGQFVIEKYADDCGWEQGIKLRPLHISQNILFTLPLELRLDIYDYLPALGQYIVQTPTQASSYQQSKYARATTLARTCQALRLELLYYKRKLQPYYTPQISSLVNHLIEIGTAARMVLGPLVTYMEGGSGDLCVKLSQLLMLAEQGGRPVHLTIRFMAWGDNAGSFIAAGNMSQPAIESLATKLYRWYCLLPNRQINFEVCMCGIRNTVNTRHTVPRDHPLLHPATAATAAATEQNMRRWFNNKIQRCSVAGIATGDMLLENELRTINGQALTWWHSNPRPTIVANQPRLDADELR